MNALLINCSPVRNGSRRSEIEEFCNGIIATEP